MKTRLAKTFGAVGALGALLLIGNVASSPADSSASRQTASLTFGKQRPGVATGVFVNIDYVNPDDPTAKPPAVRRVVLQLASGARYDTSAPEQCTASDAELMLVGAPACPPGSKVGAGVVTVDSGIPGPGRFITADVDFFNNTHQLIYLNTVRGTAARTVIRAAVSSNQVVTDAPPLPGTPPDGGAIDTVHIYEPPLARNGRAYVTTPPSCPASGRWINQLTFTYADGVQQTVQSPSPCKPPMHLSRTR